ncbi:SHOCT domain-containing protein [Stenotrophomonas acidaminiphila]|jgi:flagellar biosynthesis/type III secretory pathway M-ring protein FliF/YscJ|uniref:SHOCT domain-containing protein n=1 Tax=Stenotrophomonas acidaminiphila TaxID=128780 RepID=UPI000B14B865|nr:SHOCT domain-containing protein [Stenotrophomonas acidaminiphila]
MDAPGMQPWQWAVWVVGVTAFAVVIGLVIAAAVRAARRPPELPSAAQRLQRQSPSSPEVEAQLRELAGLQQAGRIGEVEYERRRAEVLAGAPAPGNDPQP